MSVIDSPLEGELRRYARSAAGRAARELADGSAGDAREWMHSARLALEAAKLAESPVTDGERLAHIALVAELRQRRADDHLKLERLTADSAALTTLCSSLASEFESAETATATRLAERIRRRLSEIEAGASC